MKTFVPAVLLVMTIAQPTFAAPSFPCSDAEKEQFVAFCGDRELVGLAKAMDAKLSRLMAGLDPLTRILLKRDQRWFVEMVSGQGEEFGTGRTPAHPRCLAAAPVLPRPPVRSAGGPSPAGQWANAFGTIRVTPTAARRAAPGDQGQGRLSRMTSRPCPAASRSRCSPHADGWHGATIEEEADGPPAPPRRDATGLAAPPGRCRSTPTRAACW